MLQTRTMNIMSGTEMLDAMEFFYYDLHQNDDEDLESCSKWYKESTLDDCEYDIFRIIMMVRPILPHYYSEINIRDEIARVRSYEKFEDEARDFRLSLPHCSELIYDIDSDIERMIESSHPTDPYLPVLKKIHKIFNEWRL